MVLFKRSISYISQQFSLQLTKNNVCWKNFKSHQSRSKTFGTEMAFYSTQQNGHNVKRNFLIVGLGNHDMLKTRHSVGMQFINTLAAQLGLQWKREKKCAGFVAVSETNDDQKVVLLKPKVAMNINGSSVVKTARCYGIDPRDVYLVLDDLDMAVGKFRIKHGGSARGHNGVRSVIQALGSEDMVRVLIGIDRPVSRDNVAQYVLSTFNTEDLQAIKTVITEGIIGLSHDIKHKYGVDLREMNKENLDS